MAQMFLQQSPKSQYKLSLAKSLIESGADNTPVGSPLEGAARIAKALAGAYIQKGAFDDMQAREDKYTDTLSQAMRAGRPWTAPDDVLSPDGTVVLNAGQEAPGTGGYGNMVAALMGNPDTAGLGAQMQMSQMGREQELANALMLAREKQKLEPPKTRTIKINGREITQEFDPGTRTYRELGATGIGEISPAAEAQKMRIAASGRPQNVGSIPPGYQLESGPSGAMRMVPIPGSPAAAEAADAKKAEGLQKAGEQRQADIVLEDIGRTMKLLDDSTLPATGAVGSMLSGMPGTTAHDVSALVSTIKANVGFDKLQQMRNASKTGGALGQVSENENRLLQSVLGNLEQSQSEKQFRYNLKRLKNTYLDIVHGPGNGPEREKLDEVKARSVDDLLRKYSP